MDIQNEKLHAPRIANSQLGATAVWPDQFPDDGLPEFVFVGRSNVGKSSLINCMASRKSLARTSSSPGKTRVINFFRISVLQGTAAATGRASEKISPEDLYFVDLPGYGYAKVSRSESEKWGNMIEGYLKGRRQIKHIIMLLDIRHEPTANDLELFEWLTHYNYNVIAVATKSDKLKRSQVQKHAAALKRALGVDVLPFSSETLAGRDELWGLICAQIFK
jgi:GTP-binding protein